MQPFVFANQREKGEAQPRVICHVVIAHVDGIASIRGLEPEAQMAPETRGVADGNIHPMRSIQRARAFEQQMIALLLDLEMRRRDENQRFRIPCKRLPAAMWTLQRLQESRDPIEIR